MTTEHQIRPAQVAHLQSLASLVHQAEAARADAERLFLVAVRAILAGESDGGTVVDLDVKRSMIVLEADDAPAV